MFVGHALLAFALATLVAEWRGWPARRALALGVATGAFAALPDVDLLYAVAAFDPGQLLAGTDVRPSAFWRTADGVHRTMTHSLVAAAVAGPAFGLWTIAGRDRSTPDGRTLRTHLGRLAALLALAALVAASVLASGLVAGFVMAAFVLVGLAVATLSRTVLDLSPRAVAVAAVAGVASHPWGDLVTGEPPRLLFPIEWQLLDARIVLSADPTLHLLGAFAIELAAVGLGAVVLARHAGLRPHQLVDRRAALGVAYGGAAVLMVPPTIHGSYQFVGSVLAVGAVCGAIRRPRTVRLSLATVRRRVLGEPEATLQSACTALAGIAVAVASYAAVYLLLG